MQRISTQNKHKKIKFVQGHCQTSGRVVCLKQPQQCLVAVAMAVAVPAQTHSSRDTSWPFPHPAGGDQHSATAAPLLPWLWSDSQIPGQQLHLSNDTNETNDSCLNGFKSPQYYYCWHSPPPLMLIWVEFTPTVNHPGKTESCWYKQ